MERDGSSKWGMGGVGLFWSGELTPPFGLSPTEQRMHMETDYRRYAKMLGDTPRTVEKGASHQIIVKTASRLWPVDPEPKFVTIVMAFNGRGRYVTQWTETA